MASRRCIVSPARRASQMMRVQCKRRQRLLKSASSFYDSKTTSLRNGLGATTKSGPIDDFPPACQGYAQIFWGCDLLGTLHGGEGSLKPSIWTSLAGRTSAANACGSLAERP